MSPNAGAIAKSKRAYGRVVLGGGFLWFGRRAVGLRTGWRGYWLRPAKWRMDGSVSVAWLWFVAHVVYDWSAYTEAASYGD